jgi:hypothetical protein
MINIRKIDASVFDYIGTVRAIEITMIKKPPIYVKIGWISIAFKKHLMGSIA